jgi:hypothetical protein
VKIPGSHPLVRSFALGIASLQAFASLPGLVVVLALAASHGHGHAPTFFADDGHVDLVLSHATSEVADDRHAAEQHFHSVLQSSDAHVLHLISDDDALDTARRSNKLAAPSASFALPVWRQPLPIRTSLGFREAPTPSPLLLQTVVLRI